MTTSQQDLALIAGAAEANKELQSALTQRVDALTKQLKQLDLLIKDAESNLDIPELPASEPEVAKMMQVPNAKPFSSPVALSLLENYDTPFHQDIQQRSRYVTLTTPNGWTEQEKNALRLGVRCDAMRAHAFQLHHDGEHAVHILKAASLEDYDDAKDNLDWERISRQIPGRTASMCKVQWLANDHPGVNRKPFTEGEYERLVAAVTSVQDANQEDLFDEVPVDWQAVADIVGDGRIAVDCFKAYRSGGAAKTAPLKWTETMDKELLEVIQKYGTNDWGAAANAMSMSVSRNQVRERYGVLLPSAKKGLWTAAEDGSLLAALGDADALKIPWARVAKSVPGRNSKQCRDRFFGALDPNLRKGWTDADDAALREAMKDENIDRFLLARRLGKSMDMLRKRIRMFSRDPNSRRRRVVKDKDKRPRTKSKGGGGGGKKRKRNAMEDESQESTSGVEDDESEDEGEWQGDEMGTDNVDDDVDASECRPPDDANALQAGESSTLSTRRSARRFTMERRSGKD